MTVDQLGPAVMDTAVLDVNGKKLKALIDSYGNPIAFFRFPCGNDALDASNPAHKGINTTYRDPLDSEGLLVNKYWNNAVNCNSEGGVYWFEQLCHAVHSPTSATYTWPRYMTQVLVSAGPDGKWGLNSTSGVNPDMSLDGSLDSKDNIYVPSLTPTGG